MPADLAGAKQWLADYKSNRSLDVSIPVASTSVAGDSFEDRLNRLRNSEKAIAGEIQAASSQQMDLVTLLVASKGEEKDRVEKKLAALNHRLIQLRKQHMSVAKILCDLEMKKATLARDLIDIATVRDTFIKLNMRFAQYVRHFSNGEQDEIRSCYATITNIIAGELNNMVTDLINALRNPSKDPIA